MAVVERTQYGWREDTALYRVYEQWWPWSKGSEPRARMESVTTHTASQLVLDGATLSLSQKCPRVAFCMRVLCPRLKGYGHASISAMPRPQNAAFRGIIIDILFLNIIILFFKMYHLKYI